MTEERRPELEPLATNDAAAILSGVGLWAVALLVLLIAQPGPDQRWWIWTCVAGIVGGLFGVWHVRRRVHRPAPREEQEMEPSTAVPPPRARE